jgi:hypothetical protein
MICSFPHLLELIRRSLERASPLEKQQIREALCGSACDFCGKPRLTLVCDTQTQTRFCFYCTGVPKAPPIVIREPSEFTAHGLEFDLEFLRRLRIVWEEE